MDSESINNLDRLRRLRRLAIVVLVLWSEAKSIRNFFVVHGLSASSVCVAITALTFVTGILWALFKAANWLHVRRGRTGGTSESGHPGLTELLEGCLLGLMLWDIFHELPKGEWRYALESFRYSIPFCAIGALSGVQFFGWYDSGKAIYREFGAGLLMILLMLLAELLTGCSPTSLAPHSPAAGIDMFILDPLGSAVVFNGLFFGVLTERMGRVTAWVVSPVVYMLVSVQPKALSDWLHMVVVTAIALLGLFIAVKGRRCDQNGLTTKVECQAN